MSITRILISGDILRPMADCPSVSESVARIRWFEDLLTPALAEVTDLPIGRLACEGTLCLEDLYADAGLTPSLEAWAELYAGGLPATLTDRLAGLYRDALVISKEMPPSMALALRHAGVPFIDCMVDPHRFLSDIPLSWRSSSPEVIAAMEPFRLTPFEIRRRVAQMRAKSRWMGAFEVPENATLVLDQMPSDSAMIDPSRRRRVSWLDYLEQVRALSAEGPIVWRPHPCRQWADEITEIMGQAARVDVNIYRLLSHDHLARVVAISSGGVVEARAFGKQGCHLLDRYKGIDLDGWGTPLPVVGHWVSPHFWSAALAPLMSTRADVPVVPPEKDFFRRSINCDWGFDRMDRVVVHEQREVRFDELERYQREVEGRNVELEQRTRQLEDRNAELERWAHDLEGRNAALEQHATDIERHFADLAARNATLEHRATDLEVRNAELDHHSAALAARNATLEHRATDLEVRNTDLDHHSTALEARNATLEHHSIDLEARNVTLEYRAADLEVRNTELEHHCANLEARNAALDCRATDLQARNAELESRTTDLEANNTATDHRATELEVRNTTLECHVRDLDARNIDLEHRTQELETHNTVLDQRRQDLEGRVVELEGRIKELDERISELSAPHEPPQQPSEFEQQAAA